MTILSTKPIIIKGRPYIRSEFTNGDNVLTNERGEKYLTTFTECTCLGFVFHHHCKHVDHVVDWTACADSDGVAPNGGE